MKLLLCTAILGIYTLPSCKRVYTCYNENPDYLGQCHKDGDTVNYIANSISNINNLTRAYYEGLGYSCTESIVYIDDFMQAPKEYLSQQEVKRLEEKGYICSPAPM